MAYGGLSVMSACLTVPTSGPAVANYDVSGVRLPTRRGSESIGGGFKWSGPQNQQKYPKVAKMPFSGQKTHLLPLCAEIEKERFFYWLISISRPRAIIWRAARFRQTTG